MSKVPPENIPTRIELDIKDGEVVDVTYYFEGKDMPWSPREFGWGTPTREFLESLEDVIYDRVEAVLTKARQG